jgi:hypothetical protein
MPKRMFEYKTAEKREDSRRLQIRSFVIYAVQRSYRIREGNKMQTNILLADFIEWNSSDGLRRIYIEQF